MININQYNSSGERSNLFIGLYGEVSNNSVPENSWFCCSIAFEPSNCETKMIKWRIA